MSKSLDPHKAGDYVIKAENSLKIAKIALEEGAYDNAVMSAVHSAINALDALTTSELGKRSSGQHSHVLSLLKGILTQEEYSVVNKQFSNLLGMKNKSEYQPDLMSQKEAENAVKWAGRILDLIKLKMRS